MNYDDWMEKHDLAAKRQGWSVYVVDGGPADGKYRIQRVDDAQSAAYDMGLLTDNDPDDAKCPFKQLSSDDYAMRKVRRQAKQGCEMSIEALALHLTDAPPPPRW